VTIIARNSRRDTRATICKKNVDAAADTHRLAWDALALPLPTYYATRHTTSSSASRTPIRLAASLKTQHLASVFFTTSRDAYMNAADARGRRGRFSLALRTACRHARDGTLGAGQTHFAAMKALYTRRRLPPLAGCRRRRETTGWDMPNAGKLVRAGGEGRHKFPAVRDTSRVWQHRQGDNAAVSWPYRFHATNATVAASTQR